MVGLIVAAVLILFALFVAAKTVRIIPQARAGVVERLGRYSRTLSPGMTIVVPFIDRVRPLLDLREQVVTFPPQPVITADNVSVGIDTVLYFTITEPKSATYEVANPLQAIEQLTVTTLRNIVGSLTLEEALTSRDEVNDRLRIVLDERTGKWGIRINGVELKSIDPPATIQEAMEKQMRAERDRRAAILSAEGEASAIDTVFRAIHEGDPDPQLLSYQYLQMLPQLARGEANKIWVIPSEFSNALGNLGGAISRFGPPPPPRPKSPNTGADDAAAAARADADAAAAAARQATAEAEGAAEPGAPPRP